MLTVSINFDTIKGTVENFTSKVSLLGKMPL